MQVQAFKGGLWTAKQAGGIYVVSIKDQSGLLEALTDFIKNQGILAGMVSGIGATDRATLRFFDPATRNYIDRTFEEQMEISSLQGNIAVVDSAPVLHLHITLGRQDYSALAGHLLDARIRGAGEFFVNPFPASLIKTKDSMLGLHFFDFDL